MKQVIGMDFNFDRTLAKDYRSPAQVARVLTESWVADNMYCPRCGRPHIQHFTNNRPVADFFCPDCGSEFELKSKNGRFGHKVSDGAYDTMIRRISSNSNPDFLFMSYSKQDWRVHDLIFVPKHFFWPGMIEKRAPLAPPARRAGWRGCNILLDQIPKQGRISIVAEGVARERDRVLEDVNHIAVFSKHGIRNRGWLYDVLSCVNHIPASTFSLRDIYAFEAILSEKHPENNNVRPKIRQQLQVLRDMGLLQFLGNGSYQKEEGAGKVL